MIKKDVKFKNSIEKLQSILNNKFNILSINKEYDQYYHPDAFFKYKEKYFIIEHSSSGDRKTHIGEFVQAHLYAQYNNMEVNYILIIDNQHKTGPTAQKEKERLEYYSKKLKSKLLLHVYNILEVNDPKKLASLINEIADTD